MLHAVLPHSTNAELTYMYSAFPHCSEQRVSTQQFVESLIDKTMYLVAKSRGGLRSELVATEAKIDKFGLMPENWDGYGAIQISQETLRNTKNALTNLHNLAPNPDVTPNPNGTISLEWESEMGFGHLEIGRTRFSFYIKPNIGNPIFADGEVSQISSTIGNWVSEMLFPMPHSSGATTKIIFTGNGLVHSA